MVDWWKYSLVALACLVLGFVFGYIADVPQQITFDVTPRVVDFGLVVTERMTNLTELQINVSAMECPVRLEECESICKEKYN